MPRFSLDGLVCHTEDLSDRGKEVFASLQFLEHEMHRLNEQIRTFELGKQVLIRDLEASLPPVAASGAASE